MAFTIPEDLAPEVYPLAWLLGTWRGPGFLAYPEISERPFVQEVTFGHDGGPYLTYASTIWLLDSEADDAEVAGPDAGPDAAEDSAAHGVEGDDEPPSSTEVTYTRGPVWATESGYWRPAVAADGAAASATPAGTEGGTPTDGATPSGADGATEVEVLLAEPSGHVSVYLGTVTGPRIELATDLLARTATAVDISAVHRMYGLVGGELMWAMDMAAFGHEMRPYASARLARLADASAETP